MSGHPSTQQARARRSTPRAARLGTTWVNVLVAILAIGFLLSLTLPAIQGAREAGRRNSCGCHGGNLALAVMNYTSRNGGRFPGYVDTLKFDQPVRSPAGNVVEETRVSWVVSILPYLERTDLYQRWSNGDVISKSGTADDAVGNGYMALLVCPSSGISATTPPPCTYAVNTGRQDVRAFPGHGDSPGWPADWPANGVFFNGCVDAHENPARAPRVGMTVPYVCDHDGASLTLMIGERLDCGSYAALPTSAADTEAALGVVWWLSKGEYPPPRSRRINGPRDAVAIHNAHPSSNHPCGVMVNFCDGHGRFISDDIDYSVYCKLLTPCDAECNDPGSLELVPAGSSNNYGRLRNSRLDENQIN